MKILYLSLGDTSYLQRFNDLPPEYVHIGTTDNSILLHYLPTIENDCYDTVLVAEELLKEAKPRSFANWLRILKKGGRLLLENTPTIYQQLNQGLSLLEPFASSIQTWQQHTFIIHKKHNFNTINNILYTAIATERLRNIGLAHYYRILAQTQEPNNIDVAQDTALFYERQNLFSEAQQLWQEMMMQGHTYRAELAHWLSVLTEGDYIRGFRLREQFSKRYLTYAKRSHAYPPPNKIWHEKRWKGESLNNKVFTVWSEFGLGDEIMFASLAHMLKEKFQIKQLIWVVQPPLVQLMQSHPDIDYVISAAHTERILDNSDYWDFPHTLLAHINEPFSQLPKRSPYLLANNDKIEFFSHLMDSNKRWKIGLVWRGSPSHENDKLRSIHDVSVLENLMDINDTTWFSLQKVLNDNEKNWLSQNNIYDLSDHLTDFSDTAAALKQLDILVSVDTAVVHLAGALGIPSIVMLPLAYDWRWGKPQSGIGIWYPSVYRIFQPHVACTWADTLIKVKETIPKLLQIKIK